MAPALSLDECLCPVCLEIYMEPVTLPCQHTFCKVCFLESVDKATLCCPLCRKRVSTWARLNGRNKTLVNQPLWSQIQANFPTQCERRRTGQEATEEPGGSVFSPRVSEPGELRQEYEDQVIKLTEEKRVLAEEEQRASERLIQQLLADEQEHLLRERERREEDERLARELSTQLNVPVVVPVTPTQKKKKVVGQMDKFLSPRASRSGSSSSSSASNKENFLIGRPEEEGGAKRSREPEPDEVTSSDDPDSADITSCKRLCPALGSAPSSWEEELMALREAELKQEVEDRRFALLLQKEMDEEERQRQTNRRKGSSDAYPLRATTPSEGKEEEAGRGREAASLPSKGEGGGRERSLPSKGEGRGGRACVRGGREATDGSVTTSSSPALLRGGRRGGAKAASISTSTPSADPISTCTPSNWVVVAPVRGVANTRVVAPVRGGVRAKAASTSSTPSSSSSVSTDGSTTSSSCNSSMTSHSGSSPSVTSHSGHSPSVTSPSTRSKQATLTDMFKLSA